MEENMDTSSCFYKSRPTLVIDPHNFFAQIGTDESFKQFSQFESLVQQHCEDQTISPRPQNDDQLKSKIVFVKSPRLDKWLRAQVARINGEMLDVCYVDYGTTELVAMDSVCMDVPTELQSEPPQAFRCCLFGIKPIAKSWTSRAVKCFQKLIQDKLLDTLILSSHFGTLSVALYADEDKGHRCITHLLLEEEVGLPCEIDRIPEYKQRVFQSCQSDEELEECGAGGGEDIDGATLTSGPPIPPARIPSFDTKAIETSHEVTAEVLKIGAIIQSQENTRSHLKQQLKDMSSEISSDISLHTGSDGSVGEVVGGRGDVEDHSDLIDDILSQIQKAKSATDTDEDTADDQRPERMLRNSEVNDRHRRPQRYNSPSQRNYSSSPGAGSDRSGSGPPGKYRARLNGNSPEYPVNERKRNSSQRTDFAHGRTGSEVQNGITNTSLCPPGGEISQEQNDLIQQPESGGLRIMRPQQFSKELHTMLDEIRTDGLADHKKRFDDFIFKNLNDDRLCEVMEAVLEIAVKQYDTFCPAAQIIVFSFQDYDSFGENLSSALWKLQTKYVKVSRHTNLHVKYSKLLGQLFVNSASWDDGTALSLRICVVNTLQKWIIFNKKGGGNSSEALQDIFSECFLALWEIAGESVHRMMFGEWQQIVYEMQDRILCTHVQRSVRKRMLELLVARSETEIIESGTPVAFVKSRCDLGCQATPNMVDVSTQRNREVKDRSHVGCQVDLLPGKPMTYPLSGKTCHNSEELLTPDELTKSSPEMLSSLQSPEQFVVPRYTVPISAEVLSGDARVAHVPMVVAGGFTQAGDRPGSRSSSPASRGRGRAISKKPLPQTTPFFEPSLKERIITKFNVLKNVADSQFDAASIRSRSEKRTPPVEDKPTLMTPDLFSPHSAAKNFSQQCRQSLDTNCTFDICPNQELSALSLSEDTENRIPDISSGSADPRTHHPKSPGLDAKHYLPKDPVSLFEKSTHSVVSSKEGQKAEFQTPVVLQQTKTKLKKLMLVDLRTGKSLSQKTAEIVKPAVDGTVGRTNETVRQNSFSYAAIAGAHTTNQKPENALTIKNVVDEWLKKPEESASEKTVNGGVPSGSPHPTEVDTAAKPQAGAPTTKTALPTRSDWSANSNEFPSLQEVERTDHLKANPGEEKGKGPAEENPSTALVEQFVDAEDPASSSDDEDYDWLLESGDTSESQLSENSSRTQPTRPLWNPGPRKCTICGDENHLVYDCPKKNKLLLF